MFDDLLKLLGSAGAPAVNAGLVYAAFEVFEKIASKEAKTAFSSQVGTLDVHQAAIVPEAAERLFNRIFGPRHFSLQGVVRAVLFSLAAITAMTILQRTIQFGGWRGLLHVLPTGFDRLYYSIWVPISLIPDYFNLYKTRLLISRLARMDRRAPSTWTLFAILIGDFVLGIILFLSFTRLVFPGVVLLSDLSPSGVDPLHWYVSFIESTWYAIFSPSVWFSYFGFMQDDSPLLYAGLLASAWLWLYVVAVIVTRGILHSGRLLNGVRWFLDVNEHPFRSVGVVAAVLVFLATAVIAGLAKLV